MRNRNSWWLGISLIAHSLIFLSGLGATSIEYNKDESWEVRARLIKEAKSYLGTPYLFGGKTRAGLDCSGFVYLVYKQVTGKNLARTVAELNRAGDAVTGMPVPGDLVFFDTTGGPTHVGISAGGKKFYHAASAGPRLGVTVDSLDAPYYSERYLGARRILADTELIINMTIDDKPAKRDFSYTFPPGKPIFFYLKNKKTQAKNVLIRVNKDDAEFFTKRIRLEPEQEPSLLWFIPGDGMWEVELYTETSTAAAEPAAGQKLAIFYFRSGEMQ